MHANDVKRAVKDRAADNGRRLRALLAEADRLGGSVTVSTNSFTYHHVAAVTRTGSRFLGICTQDGHAHRFHVAMVKAMELVPPPREYLLAELRRLSDPAALRTDAEAAEARGRSAELCRLLGVEFPEDALEGNP